MKSICIFTVFIALVCSSAFAQLATLPPISAFDGNPISGIGVNSGATHWEDPNTLGRYRIASDANLPLPSGLAWASTVPASLSARITEINRAGGTLSAIFLGESAGWLNDFGYTYTGHADGANSFTVFTNIQALAPASVAFGDHVNLSLLPGDASALDFWFNAADSFVAANPPPPTSNGGVYLVFNQANSVPYIAPGNVKFAQSPLMVNTWVASSAAYEDIPTYLVAIEDWRTDRGADKDISDFIFAMQVFEKAGLPLDDVPVPEPSTFGLVGLAGLFMLMGWRRMIRRAAGSS